MLIPKQVLNFGLHVTANEKNRYAINKIALRKNGNEITATATNGKIAAQVSWSEDIQDPNEYPYIADANTTHSIQAEKDFLLDPKSLKSVYGAIDKKNCRPLLSDFVSMSENGVVRFDVSDGENSQSFNFSKSDEIYPNVSSFFEEKRELKSEITLSIVELEKLLDAVKKTGFDSVKIKTYEEKDPVFIFGHHKNTEPNGLNIRALIMPISTD